MAVGFATKRGISIESAEDFAHDWILKIQLRGKKQSLLHAFIDHCRNEFGRNDVQKKHENIDDYDLVLSGQKIPESYVVDLAPEKLKEKIGMVNYRLLLMMIDNIDVKDRCFFMEYTYITIHRRQHFIRKVINEILDTRHVCHRPTK